MNKELKKLISEAFEEAMSTPKENNNSDIRKTIRNIIISEMKQLTSGSLEFEKEDKKYYIEYNTTPFISATYLQPSEGGEIEIISIKDEQGNTVPKELFSQNEIEEIKEKAEDQSKGEEFENDFNLEDSN